MLTPRPSTLRARLILLGAVAVIPVTAGILYAGLEQRRQAMADIRREALALARSSAQEEDRLILETRQLLSVLAQVPRVRGGDNAECGAFLATVLAQSERYANLGVAGPDGMILCSALPFTAPVDVSSRTWFQRTVETGGFSVGEYQVGRITGVQSLNFGYPIRAGDELVGVTFAALPLTWLQDQLDEAQLPEGSEVLVVDGAATVLARYPQVDGWAGRSLAGTELAEAILTGPDTHVAEASGTDGTTRLYATTFLRDGPEQDALAVSVGVPTEVVYGPVRAEVGRNFGLLALTLLLVLGVTWWTSGRLVLKPVQALLLATQRMSRGDLDTRTEIRGAPREIDELAGSFNQMATALQAHMREIREHLQHIERLNRVRAVLSGINSALLRARDRGELLQEACRISVEQGGFGLAWVAEPHPETAGLRVATWAADSAEEERVGIPEALRSAHGMVATALREGREVVSNRLAAEPPPSGEPESAPLFRSGAALPLKVEETPVAALNLYTSEADFFNDEEIRLLRELSADVSLGLEFLEKESQLHYLANYDPLTDLPNRLQFTDRLAQALDRSRAGNRLVGVLLVSILRFSEINATFGNHAGDLVLRTVAERLRALVGAGDTVARLGSKDFGVVLAELDDVREIQHAAHALLVGVPHELRDGEDHIFLQIRIGVAVFPHDGADPETLLQGAALALEAPEPAPVAFYSAELNALAQQRRILEQELRSAIAGRQLTLFYQPVLDVASGAPLGMEALLRWQSPVLGEVSPATFVPLAEEMGLIGELGEWVLATAARQAKRLHEDGLGELRMNVNVSVRQLRQPGFIEGFRRVLDETGVDLSRLGIGIEITETELMENIEQTVAALEDFRRMGVWIYIDDFGTGYSSLSYLRILPINSLKIDRSFINDLPGDRDAVAIVKAIIALARSLDLRVIAEGVETEEQLALLRELGCDAVQGYLLSRPLRTEELESFLVRRV